MPKRSKSIDPFKRDSTRWPGVTYREKADGSRSYFVRHAGKQVLVEGGEKEARELQAKQRTEPKKPSTSRTFASRPLPRNGSRASATSAPGR